MKWEGILSVAIPLFLVVSFAQNTRVETKDVQPVQRFEQVISGHVTDLNGKYKFRVSEVTYQPGGYVGDHNHAGPGVRVIMAGEFTYVKGDKTTVYKAGDAFFEPGDMTHRAYNRGNTILKVMNIEILPADFSWVCAYTAAALSRADSSTGGMMHQNIDRRAFLKTSANSLAALASGTAQLCGEFSGCACREAAKSDCRRSGDRGIGCSF